MEGEGRAPKPTGPQKPKLPPEAASSEPREPRAPQPPAATSSGRASFVSVDLEDVEMVPPSVEEIAGDDIEIEFEDGAERGSVDKLLAMTGENWSIEEQRESLKEAAKKDRTSEVPPANDAANARPSLSLPTPYELGGADLVTEHPATSAATATAASAPRSLPPPLPPSGSPSQRPSSPPPPQPARDRDRSDDTGSALRPPPLPGSRAATTTKVIRHMKMSSCTWFGNTIQKSFEGIISRFL